LGQGIPPQQQGVTYVGQPQQQIAANASGGGSAQMYQSSKVLIQTLPQQQCTCTMLNNRATPSKPSIHYTELSCYFVNSIIE